MCMHMRFERCGARDWRACGHVVTPLHQRDDLWRGPAEEHVAPRLGPVFRVYHFHARAAEHCPRSAGLMPGVLGPGSRRFKTDLPCITSGVGPATWPARRPCVCTCAIPQTRASAYETDAAVRCMHSKQSTEKCAHPVRKVSWRLGGSLPVWRPPESTRARSFEPLNSTGACLGTVTALSYSVI